MNESLINKISESIEILEDLFSSNLESQSIIKDLISFSFQKDDLEEAFTAIKTMYGKEVSKGILRLLSSPNNSLDVIRDNNYKYENFYKLIIATFRKQFLRLRIIEEDGPTTMMRISENVSNTSLDYLIERADNTLLNFKVTYDNQLGITNYLVNVLNNYISDSNKLDSNDFEEFKEDIDTLKNSLTNLEKNVLEKLEEISSNEG